MDFARGVYTPTNLVSSHPNVRATLPLISRKALRENPKEENIDCGHGAAWTESGQKVQQCAQYKIECVVFSPHKNNALADARAF